MRSATLAALLLGVIPGVARGQSVTIGTGEDIVTGTLTGRVCEDSDGDGRCSAAEKGIPRARVLLEDGTFAIADGEGRYHLNAVPSRRSELALSRLGESVVREGLGRHVVKVDPRSLGPGARTANGGRVVVELGPAALVNVDFPVTYSSAGKAAPLEPAPGLPPRGEVGKDQFFYLVTGKAAPGHSVDVEGMPAKITADGLFSARVPLVAGRNVLLIADAAPDGGLFLFSRDLEVVQRAEGGVLFIPGPFKRIGVLTLPAPTTPAAAAAMTVPVEAPPGTTLKIGERLLTVDASGTLRAELVLKPGENRLPIEITPPGGPTLRKELVVRAEAFTFAAALLDVELSYDRTSKELTAQGRGAATLERTFGRAELVAGIDLDSSDVSTLRADRLVLLRPRTPFNVERALDPDLYPPETGDDGLAGALNPSRARLFAKIAHPTYGSAQLGSFHADLTGVQVGRYERSLFGAAADGKLPLGPLTLRGKIFAAPDAAAGSEPQPTPAHDELTGTGGSLFYLRHSALVPGSEKLRVELRDGATSLPLEERALVRNVDYEIDYRAGRVILARPLAMSSGDGPFLAASPLQGHRPVLIADYEHRPVSGAPDRVLGGRIGASLDQRASVNATAVQERRSGDGSDDFRLLGANGKARLGPVTLAADVAQSEGSLFSTRATGGFGLSDTGGLSFLEAAPLAAAGPARAAAVRAAISEEGYGGQLWLRTQQKGFSDSTSAAQVDARQVGGRVRVEVGKVELGAFADDRVSADPRNPFGPGTIGARDAALRAKLPLDRLTLSAEGTYASLRAAPELGAEEKEGGRAGVGVRADYQLVRELSVNASHHQRLAGFGEGIGALDDTFSAVGATYHPKDDLGLTLRGGWGPAIGTQVQIGAERVGKDEIGYSGTTVDLDGPDAGRLTAVSGARKRVDEEADVFAEELFARDPNALRMGRAVGIELAPQQRLSVRARYERGVLAPLGFQSPGQALLRDTGNLRASFIVSKIRLSALGEVRHERGNSLAESAIDRIQLLGGLSAEARPLPMLGLSSRLNVSNTHGARGLEARFVEGNVGAALRLAPLTVLVRYALIGELPPPERRLRGEEVQHLISLQPAVDLGSRFRLSSGFHAGLFHSRTARSNVVAASLRPAVRVFEGIELAVEGARRSGAPSGQELNALRAEVGYRFEGILGAALGYNFYGFSGTGVTADTPKSDRLYLRLEAAY